MRLISCSIENFGGLSHYTVQFQPGVTVIEEPNGFGKTTLAEFIRAMFYGFPRASRTLEKNSRKRYLPWQGGRYGGTLVFEHEGKRYRIDRTFGSVPKQDTFALYDADTRRRSTDFSENIGLELFQLDSDSFERSTYMPQIHDHASLTTASIQAKLGDLVEDTNDINNFDKAMAALRAKRSSYIPFRGSGGVVAEAQENISALQTELGQAESLYGELEEIQRAAARRREEQAVKQGALTSIRREMTRASEAAARQALVRQYEGLKTRRAESAAALEALNGKYPAGLPDRSELERIAPLYDRVVALDSQVVRTEAESEAESVVRAGARRFAAGVPDTQTFREQQEKCRACLTAESTLKNADLSDYEKDRLAELEAFFRAGVPDESFLEDCRELLDELRRTDSARRALGMSSEEENQKKNLEIYFAQGVPAREELEEKQAQLREITALREENVQITAAQVQAVREAPPAGKGRSPLALAVLAVGAAALLLGIILLTRGANVPGGVGLGAGVLALLAAVYLNLKQVVSNEISASRQGVAALGENERERIRRNEQRIETLEGSVRTFVTRYVKDEGPLADKLLEIQTKCSQYAALAGKGAELDEKAQTLGRRSEELTARLTARLAPYGRADASFEERLLGLRTGAVQLEELRRKKASLERTMEHLREETARLRREITDFLRPFYGEVSGDALDERVAALQRECEAYENAVRLMTAREQRLAEREAALKECAAAVEEMEQRYGIRLDLRDRGAFQTLCDEEREAVRLMARLRQDDEETAAFFREHQAVLQAPETGLEKDLEGLKRAELGLEEELSGLSGEILELEQRARLLQTQTDALPGKEDDLERWKRVKAEGIHNSEILDRTMDFLQRAKDALSDNYLGAIQQSFGEYLHQLTGEARENIVVTADLDVQMERLGEARDLAYFSTGQSDLVTLCMRLALVDALFKETKPFIILDDPFVNLDDGHTEEALKLLRRIGTEHQVIYLVCNSSRSLSV